MQTITRALQRAKENSPIPDLAGSFAESFVRRRHSPQPRPTETRKLPGEAIRLDEDVLRLNRLIGFDPDAASTRYYDILRNQISQHRPRASGTQIVAVSAPTKSCGTTVIATNLAFSFARTGSQRVTLLDANDEHPSIRRIFGLSGRGHPDPAAGALVTPVRVRDVALNVATIANTDPEQGDVAKRLQRLCVETETTLLVVDLAPLLTSDRTLAVLGTADSVVVVLAEGRTTHAEVESCKTFVRRSPDQLQFVLNNCGRHGL